MSSSPEGRAWVDVFSGRPPPTWPVGPGLVDEIRRRWESSASLGHPTGRVDRLGYRGAGIRVTGGETWFARHGIVERSTDAASEARLDEGRAIERLIVGSAPPGVLPSWLSADRLPEEGDTRGR